MLIIKSLYGLKSSESAFRAFIADNLDKMGYRPSYSDLNIWLWPAVKPEGFEYYKYIIFLYRQRDVYFSLPA